MLNYKIISKLQCIITLQCTFKCYVFSLIITIYFQFSLISLIEQYSKYVYILLYKGSRLLEPKIIFYSNRLYYVFLIIVHRKLSMRIDFCCPPVFWFPHQVWGNALKRQMSPYFHHFWWKWWIVKMFWLLHAWETTSPLLHISVKYGLKIFKDSEILTRWVNRLILLRGWTKKNLFAGSLLKVFFLLRVTREESCAELINLADSYHNWLPSPSESLFHYKVMSITPHCFKLSPMNTDSYLNGFITALRSL